MCLFVRYGMLLLLIRLTCSMANGATTVPIADLPLEELDG